MAQGKLCPKCGYYMFALEEEEGLEGSWIVYECRNEDCKFRVKVFEDKVNLGNFDKVETKASKYNDLRLRCFFCPSVHITIRF